MADTASLIVRVNSAGVAETARELDNLTGSSGRADTATNKLGNTSQQAVPKTNALRASIGNAGYQVQDFIVQIQGGQSALVAFTQQGSQLVSAFNPIAGTILTIAAVAGGALYSAFSDASSAADNLAAANERLDNVITETTPGVYDLNESLEKLEATKANAAETNAFLSRTQEDLKTRIDATNKSIVEQIKRLTEQNALQAGVGGIAAAQLSQGGRGGRSVDELRRGSRAESVGVTTQELAKLDKAIEDIQNKVPGAARSALELVNSITPTPETEKRFNAIRQELNLTGIQIRDNEAQLNAVNNAEKTYETAKEDRAQKDILRQRRIGDAAAARAARQLAADQRAQESAQKQADAFVATLDRNTGTELQRIDANEQQKLAKLKEYRDQQLLGDQQYEESKSAIQAEFQAQRDALYLNADAYLARLQALGNVEFEEIKRQNDAKLEQLNDLLARQLISQEQYAAAVAGINRQMVIDQTNASENAFGSIASDAKSAFGEASAAYKAFAITQATIATYTAAIEAYKSTAAIPIVGPFLAPVAAGLAIAAGTANIAKISGAREQGGQLNAGGDYLVGERGPEIIRAGSAARALSASDTRAQLSSSPSNGNITIVNNTSSQIGNVSTEEDDEGRLRIIIEEQVAASLQNSNSRISKARKATRNAPGFK